MLLCRKIKIEVSDQDAATLEFMQGKCRGLYNWWVMQLRNGERWNVYAAKKTLQKSRKHDPEINGVYGKLLHEVFFRLDEAMQAFFRRVAEGEKKPGFPRIKPLATGVNDQGRFYHIGGFKGYRWYNKQLDKIRSKRDRCKKKSRRYLH